MICRCEHSEAIQRPWIYPFGAEGFGMLSQPRRFAAPDNGFDSHQWVSYPVACYGF